MALFIGIDLGTSGCRALAINKEGEVQGTAMANLAEPVRKGTRVEQDPSLWWNAVDNCLSGLMTQIDNQDVRAIAVDGTSATVLLVDKNGSPLNSALMYNDARAIEQASRIAEVAPTNTAAHGATCTLAKLLWLYTEGFHDKSFGHREAFSRVAHVMHQADWITARLCNQYGVSDYNNVMKLGFDAEHFGTKQQTWPDWLISLLTNAGIPIGILPRPVKPGTPIGTITTDIAQRFNLPRTTQVVAGTTDSTASFIATGASQIGDAVTALGSTLVLKVISDRPIFAPKYGVYSHPFTTTGEELWLVGGASNSGGAVLKQFFTPEQLNTMTPQLNPESPTGLEYYPLPSIGERFPLYDATLKPVLEPRPKDDTIFFQAILEGIARIEANGYRLLAELGAPYPVTVRTTGGGAANNAWTEIRKMMLSEFAGSHCKLVDAKQTQAAYGAAILASVNINEDT